jgi:putative copper resistance protein D
VRALYLASVWLHVVAAAAWTGALIFVAAVLVPTLRRVDPAVRSRVLRDSGGSLRRLGWTTFGVLAVTGVVNLAGRGFALDDLGGRLWAGPFGRALAWKLGLFAVLLAASALHDFHLGPRAAAAEPLTPEAARLRRAAGWLGRLELLLTLALLVFAVFLVRGWP